MEHLNARVRLVFTVHGAVDAIPILSIEPEAPSPPAHYFTIIELSVLGHFS